MEVRRRLRHRRARALMAAIDMGQGLTSRPRTNALTRFSATQNVPG